MCGEHLLVALLLSLLVGSSPHVRGALVDSEKVDDEAGIIPACAGSTTGVKPLVYAQRDHPRMCGEH